MTDASAARIRAVFEFKSATLPLIALILKTVDLRALAEALNAQLADSPDFFEQEPMVIDLSQLPESDRDAPIDFPTLRALLERYQTQPVAVRGGSPAQHAAARAAGMSVAAMPTAPAPAQRTPPAPAAKTQPQSQQQLGAQAPTLVIDRPLRSGQQVYARNGDVIVMEVVNFGAEVIADGNIHVYAPLRGKAIAGARGNTEACIFTTCLEAQLVAIAGIYRTGEVPLAKSVAGRPAQIRLENGNKLVIKALI